MADELVEKVAKIVRTYEEGFENPLEVAERIIAVMSEPTPEMIDAGDNALGESGVYCNEEWTSEDSRKAVRDIYLAMISQGRG